MFVRPYFLFLTCSRTQKNFMNCCEDLSKFQPVNSDLKQKPCRIYVVLLCYVLCCVMYFSHHAIIAYCAMSDPDKGPWLKQAARMDHETVACLQCLIWDYSKFFRVSMLHDFHTMLPQKVPIKTSIRSRALAFDAWNKTTSCATCFWSDSAC